jgi:hypothetical protein
VDRQRVCKTRALRQSEFDSLSSHRKTSRREWVIILNKPHSHTLFVYITKERKVKLKVYQVYYQDPKEPDRAFVAAFTPSKAKYIAVREERCKFRGYDYEDLRALRIPDLDERIEKGDPYLRIAPTTEERWLFDNETSEDVLESERKWFDGQCLT